MSAYIVAPSSEFREAQSASFKRAGGIAACLTGVGGLLYAVSFVVIARSDPVLGGMLSALLLMLNGLLGTLALTALYERVREQGVVTLWAWLLAIVAALGAAIHGGYDLANALHPPASLNADVPNPIDPRGFLTFGVAGIALFAFAWLIARQRNFPRRLAYLAYLLATLLVAIYLGRLIILDPAHPLLLGPVLIAGFLVNPAWYIWLGITLLRKPRA